MTSFQFAKKFDLFFFQNEGLLLHYTLFLALLAVLCQLLFKHVFFSF